MQRFFEIHMSGLRSERRPLTTGLTTIGTGPGDQVRLPSSTGLAPRQLEITNGEKGVQIQIPQGVAGHFIYEGTEQRQVWVPFGGEIFIGKVRVAFPSVKRQRSVHPVLLVLAPIILIAAGLSAYGASPPVDSSPDVVPAPSLFLSQGDAPCAENDPKLALDRAVDDERAAFAKWERSTFFPGEGPRALQLMTFAIACYQRAGTVEEVARLQPTESSWRTRLGTQYAAAQAQLRWALNRGNTGAALGWATKLRTLLEHQQPGPYRQWLDELKRYLENSSR